MWLIRGFLWSLVASLCYQGYLKPQHEGFFSRFTMPILFSQTKSVPRVFVLEAIKETQRHPNLLHVPKIKKRLAEVQKTLDYVRKAELSWRLDFQDLITSLQVTQPWRTAVRRLESLRMQEKACWIPTRTCVILTTQLRAAQGDPWLSLMRFEAVKASAFIQSQYLMSPRLSDEVHRLYTALEDLYNVTAEDKRFPALICRIDRLSWAFRSQSQIIKILMLGDLWSACMSHAIQQDHRIHSLLDRSGIIEVQQIRERIYNTSVVGLLQDDISMIVPWFDEATTWSWWLPDTIPAIVRRCITQTTGECKRIGSAEIDSLMSRSDVPKSIHMGLWSGLPLVICIFIGELLIEYFKKSPPMTVSFNGLSASSEPKSTTTALTALS